DACLTAPFAGAYPRRDWRGDRGTWGARSRPRTRDASTRRGLPMGMSAARRPAFARVRVVWAAWPARSLRRGRLGRRTRPVSPTAGSRWPASRSERRRDAPNAASSATLPRLALGHERLPLAEAPRNLHLGQPRLTARLAQAGEK